MQHVSSVAREQGHEGKGIGLSNKLRSYVLQARLNIELP